MSESCPVVDESIVYVVLNVIDGLGHKDLPRAVCEGVFTEMSTAENVSRVCSGRVVPVRIDCIHPGYIASFKELFGRSIS
jgi:hypothetical protein